MNKKTLIICALILLSSSFSFGQSLSNLHKKFFIHANDTITLDSLPIIPNSLIVLHKNQKLKSNSYSLIWWRGLLLLPSPLDSITVIYRTFDHKFPSFPKPKVSITPKYSKTYFIPPINDFSQPQNLNINGSISRGLTFGSNISANATSNISLNIKGKLSDSISINGNIASNSSPKYPNSPYNYYNFQDFNKVIFTVKTPKFKINVGDIFAQNSFKYLKFNKAVKGINFSSVDSSKSFNIGLGAQKGIYCFKRIIPQDNNQGPYKITGCNNESMIIIISGTVKVWVDGKLKKPGFNNDYIIDYSNAQITFTSNCIINKYSRIYIQFQYWQNSIPKILTWFNYVKKNKTLSLGLAAFISRDNLAAFLQTYKNLSANLASYDSSSAQILNAQKTLPSKGLYCLRDTVINNHLYHYFKFSPNKTCSQWNVFFKFVGKNKGEYKQLPSSNNYPVFVFVGPNKGDFSPVKNISLPTQNQYIASFLTHKTSNNSFKISWAFNHRKKNLLNPKALTNALALHLSNSTIHSLNKNLKLKLSASTQTISKDFLPISNIFPVEFLHNWNLSSLPKSNLFNLKLSASIISPHTQNTFASEFLLFPKNYFGQKLLVNFLKSGKKLNYNFNSFILKTKNQNITSYYFNSFGNLSLALSHKILFALQWQTEHNKKYLFYNVLPTSYQYLALNPTLIFGDSSKNFFKLSLFHRTDINLANDSLTNIYNYIKTALNLKNKFSVTQLSLNLGKISNSDTSYKTYQLTLNSQLSFHNSKFSIFAQNMASQLQYQQFYFLKVPDGTGKYSWIDLNHDNKQQINEFVIAKFPDKANYIKVFLPTMKFIPTFSNRLSANFYLFCQNPNFSSSLSINWFEQIPRSKFIILNLQNPAVLQLSQSLIQQSKLSLTKKLTIFNITNISKNKSFLLGGYILSVNQNINSGLTFRLKKSSINLSFNLFKNLYTNSQFQQNSYAYHGNEIKISFQKGEPFNSLSFSADIKYVYSDSSTLIAQIKSLNVFLQKQLSKKLQTTVSISTILNKTNNLDNYFLAYNLLNGYTQPRNLSIQTNIIYKLTQNLNLIVIYQNRLSSNKPIQTFNIKISASF